MKCARHNISPWRHLLSPEVRRICAQLEVLQRRLIRAERNAR